MFLLKEEDDNGGLKENKESHPALFTEMGELTKVPEIRKFLKKCTVAGLFQWKHFYDLCYLYDAITFDRLPWQKNLSAAKIVK